MSEQPTIEATPIPGADPSPAVAAVDVPDVVVNPDPPGVELKAGDVVFYEAAVFGEPDATFAGLVLAAGDGRARVHTLGLARDVADFPAGDLRLSP